MYLVAHTNLGRRLRKGKEEMIPLGNFDIGDVIVINEGETIPLGGKLLREMLNWMFMPLMVVMYVLNLKLEMKFIVELLLQKDIYM